MLGVALSIGLFILLPTLLGGIFDRWLHSPLARCIIEGVLRIVIFLAYLILISKTKDMKRVFSYHGAEHKSIRCYEARLPSLTAWSGGTTTGSRISSRPPACGCSVLPPTSRMTP